MEEENKVVIITWAIPNLSESYRQSPPKTTASINEKSKIWFAYCERIIWRVSSFVVVVKIDWDKERPIFGAWKFGWFGNDKIWLWFGVRCERVEEDERLE